MEETAPKLWLPDPRLVRSSHISAQHSPNAIQPDYQLIEFHWPRGKQRQRHALNQLGKNIETNSSWAWKVCILLQATIA